MIIHIKRMDLFAILTLENDEGRRFTTTMNREIQKDDAEIKAMIRRFNNGDPKVCPEGVKSKMTPTYLKVAKDKRGRKINRHAAGRKKGAGSNKQQRGAGLE